ncbi:MAG: S-layer homology domain-containing protein [Oscillospiraceae bacterium]|nr:S-layer homology domain-containing protein [Oscillospiraceae bacterium]
MRKILSILLTLALCIGLMPVMAFAESSAATTGSGTEADPWVVYNWAALKEKMAAGGYIQLGEDVTDQTKSSSSYLVVPSNGTVSIDLNGYTIDRGLTAATDKGYVILFDGESNNDGGTLTITDSSGAKTGQITGGFNSEYAGGVYVAHGGTLNLQGGSIAGNRASYGGGIYVGRGTFNMTDGSISNNIAVTGTGGGIGTSYATIKMTGGTISGNKADADAGGGIFLVMGSTCDISSGSITGNTALRGGGIFHNGGTLNLSGGSITGNISTEEGGGITISQQTTFNLSGNPVVTGNTGAGGKTHNLWLRWAGNSSVVNDPMVTVTGTLTSGASIGVSLVSDRSNKTFTSGFAANSGSNDPTEFFFSDDSAYVVASSGDEARLSDPTPYGLYIAGTQVNSANAGDLSVISGVSGTVKYDDSTKTLTLSDATIDGGSNANAISSSIKNLTITFSGNNTITARTSGSPRRGIDVYQSGTGSLTLAGTNDSATLTVKTPAGGASENGAIRGDYLIVTGGTVTCEAPEGAYGNPAHVPYAVSLNGGSDALSVTGGKLICKGWAPLAFAVSETTIKQNTVLSGTASYDGSGLEPYDYDNNGGFGSSGWQNTYRYVEATPLLPITVYFEADGGTVSPESITVTPGGTYGELPEPKKDGFIFDGWVLCEGGGNRLIANDSFTNEPLFRLATSPGDKAWDAYTESNFKVGNTIVFDVTFDDTTPRRLEVNDRDVDSSLYTIESESGHIYGRIKIISAYQNGRHHFIDIVTRALAQKYTVDKFYVIDPNSTESITADSTVEMTENHALLAKWIPVYNVTVGPGKNMTLSSGTEKQTVTKDTAITSVVYTADEGYYFPTDYETTPVNGIGTTRDSFTQITVSGTPTANTTFYPADATAKTKPDAPSAAATDCTTEANNDGTITDVDSTMEYQKSGDSDWTAITGSTVEGLAPGTYSVRIKETDTTLASDAVSVTIAEYVAVPKADTPVFTPGAQNFTESIDVTITCALDGATVYYTDDGSEPSETNGTVTTGAAITLDKTTTLKAIAVMTGYDDSDVAEATYTLKAASGGGGGGGSAPETYAVTPAEAENGKIEVSSKNAAEDDKVTITVTPEEGYELDKLIVKDKDGNEIEVTDNGDGTYTFKMPDSEVEIEPVFKEAEPETPADEFPFVDVPEDAYFRKAVEWALKEGVTGGTTPTTFSPKAPATRAQMITFLWAVAGAPEPEATENPFKDVAEDAYYYKAVMWAYEKGITAGVSEGMFGPDQTVTRAQAATFLYGVAGRPDAGSEPFTDVNDGDYFEAPVAWAYKEGITAGTSETLFSPDADCLREQIITFMYLFFCAE